MMTIEELRKRLAPLNSSHEAAWILDFAKKSADPDAKIEEIILRRSKDEPLAYIFGKWAFREHDFFVGPGVLIPRPETEELVEYSLLRAQKLVSHATGDIHCLDLGAGSGCIGLSFIAELPQGKIHMTCVEPSLAARAYLQKNVQHFLEKYPHINVDIFSGTWLEWSQQNPEQKIDTILSNPPYLSHSELDQTHNSVHGYEPISALLPDDVSIFPDATGPYRDLFYLSKKHLRGASFIGLELGPAQAEWIEEYARNFDFFSEVELIKDLSGKPRFFFAQTR